MERIPIHELPSLPRRRFDSHKGTSGKVLVVAGSRGMSGAAVLSGRSALRSGAGLVQVATPTCVQSVVAAGYPCYTTLPLHQHSDGTLTDTAASDAASWASSASAVAIGPGLGGGSDVRTFVHRVVSELAEQLLVVDADGLNALSPFTTEWKSRPIPLVLTPHPGEFARLTGRSASEIRTHREELACEFAATHGCVLLLKGANTLVTDGGRVYRNSTGNPGMATGGSGDVLTGVIASLLCQLPPFEAAVLGAWIHGRAGDLAAHSIGEIGMTAADIIEHLPRAIQERLL